MIAGKWTVGACRIAAELRKLGEIAGERCGCGEMRRCPFQFIEDADLELREGQGRRCLGSRSVDHGYPEDAPAENTERREQIDQALSRSQFRLLSATARPQDLMEVLIFQRCAYQ